MTTHRTAPAWSSLLGLLGLATLACGGHSSHTGDDDPLHERGGGASGETGGGGGTGGGGMGGSSSTPPPTPAAIGLTLTLSPPEPVTTVDISGRSCTAGGVGTSTYTIGKPAANGTIENGTDGVMVDCTVRADGSFALEAAGSDTETKQRLSLSVTGTAERSATSSGSLQVYTPDTLALGTGSPFPDCTLGPATIVKLGALLTDFSCPIVVGDDPSAGCAAKGTIAVEYCKTGEEEN